MDYVGIRTQYTGLINNRALTADTTLQKTFVQQALTYVQRKLRVPAMEAAVSLTWDGTTYPNGELPIPSDLLELINITYTDASGGYTLRKVDTSSAVTAQIGDVDHPLVYSRRGSVWVLGPTPTDGDALRIDYYQEIPALSADTDTNWLTTIGSDIIIYGALFYAGSYYNDKRTAGWQQIFETLLADLQSQSDMDALTGSAQVSPTYILDDGLDGDG